MLRYNAAFGLPLYPLLATLERWQRPLCYFTIEYALQYLQVVFCPHYVPFANR